ncbi:hypothetical protein E4U19_002028 [Claviceps sp. Clav32 group G5]|nr:hypothetical protein E4U19_002028 [Claviceps sp. Clav32 group G5]
MFESVPSIQETQKAEQKMNTTVQARGKRKRSPSTTPDVAKKMVQTLAPVHSRCSSRSPHSLQNLPLELLESIFLYSMNFALPRSSPLLGARLSGRATLLRLFIVGFHDTWDQCFGISAHRVIEPQIKDLIKTNDASLRLQSELLSMPWVDIDFILEAQQIWADKYARGRCYRHYEHEGSDVRNLYEKNVHARDRYLQHVRQHEEKTWKFDARACFEADYERALQLSPIPEFFLQNSLWGSMDVDPSVQMPMHLFTGPWNEEMKRRLFWFVRAGILVADCGVEDLGKAWQMRLVTLDAAVLSPEKPDPLLIKCLMGPFLLENMPSDIAHNRLVKLCRRIRRGGDTPDIRELLRHLVREIHRDQQSLEDPDYDGEDLDDESYDKLYNELVDESREQLIYGIVDESDDESDDE